VRGALVFTDSEACRVRVIGLGGGRERPAGDLVTFCGLSAAPIGQRIAFSTGDTDTGGQLKSWRSVAPEFPPPP
jgi:hypothetical protein